MRVGAVRRTTPCGVSTLFQYRVGRYKEMPALVGRFATCVEKVFQTTLKQKKRKSNILLPQHI